MKNKVPIPPAFEHARSPRFSPALIFIYALRVKDLSHVSECSKTK